MVLWVRLAAQALLIAKLSTLADHAIGLWLPIVQHEEFLFLNKSQWSKTFYFFSEENIFLLKYFGMPRIRWWTNYYLPFQTSFFWQNMIKSWISWVLLMLLYFFRFNKNISGKGGAFKGNFVYLVRFILNFLL